MDLKARLVKLRKRRHETIGSFLNEYKIGKFSETLWLDMFKYTVMIKHIEQLIPRMAPIESDSFDLDSFEQPEQIQRPIKKPGILDKFKNRFKNTKHEVERMPRDDEEAVIL